jgi:ribonuclease P protein component
MNSSARHKIKSIKSQNEIKQLLSSGKKIYTKFGIFFLGKNENPEKQVAVLVKKAVGIAVKRNYYKRILREYIRTSLDNFSDYNKIIFVINKRIDVPFSQLKMELDQKFLL